MCCASDQSSGQKNIEFCRGEQRCWRSPSCQQEFNCLWPPVPVSPQSKQTTAASPPPLQHQQDLGCSLLILLGIPVTGVQNPAPRPCVRCLTLPQQAGAAGARLLQPHRACGGMQLIWKASPSQKESSQKEIHQPCPRWVK